jgi:hypothetical protein
MQVHNRRLKPDDFDVRVLRNELINLLPELDELEFPAERLKVDCVFHPDFRRHPLDRRQKQPEIPSKARDGTT